MSKEALKACLLPKETRCFVYEHRETKTIKKEATNVLISEDLPFGEASESNEVTIKKRRVTKKLSVKSFLSC